MKVPLVALLFAKEHHEPIVRAEKKITIREGHRDYRADTPVVLCCHIASWAVMADITNVRHCLLQEVTEEEWRADGYDSQEHMLESLRSYYSDLTLSSPVTIIQWENVRGGAVPQGRGTKCPKCGSAGGDHEVRNYNQYCHDGDVYCTKCGAYVRYYDAS